MRMRVVVAVVAVLVAGFFAASGGVANADQSYTLVIGDSLTVKS